MRHLGGDLKGGRISYTDRGGVLGCQVSALPPMAPSACGVIVYHNSQAVSRTLPVDQSKSAQMD